MRFPFEPNVEHPPGRFLIQDTGYRRRILPLFTFAQGAPEMRVLGQGTVFRIDPWGNCATAFHVFEGAFYLGGKTGREMLVRQERSILALEVEEFGYGAPAIASHQWRPMSGANSLVKVDEPPFQAPQIRNLTELLALSIAPSVPKIGGTEYLHVDLNTWKPTVGDVILGVGYPNLDQPDEGEDASDDRPICQDMYGAYGRITDIEPLDLSRGRPWPMVRVIADWPGGMSGGPVFNAAGNVIGIISSGFDATSSTAMVFGGWNAMRHTLRSLDPAKPGSFICYAVLDATERLIDVALGRPSAETIATQIDGTFVSKVSLDQETGNFVRLEF
jgi:serine protease Do